MKALLLRLTHFMCAAAQDKHHLLQPQRQGYALARSEDRRKTRKKNALQKNEKKNAARKKCCTKPYMHAYM
jgi:hypothetical protein